jgi:uncharacterized protein
MSENAQGFLPGRHAIDGYGSGGFGFAGMTHRGSILALPSGVYAWEAIAPGDIDEASLARVFAEEAGSILHLVIGTGEQLVPVAPALKARLRAAGMVAEPMATGAAIRTYNILLGEKRLVAAALLAAR